MKAAIAVGLLIASAAVADAAWADSTPPLVLEYKIVLDHVHGRIDHLAADVARERLFVAELGNDTVGVVDLKSRTVIRTLSGFHQPQGIGYEPATDTLYIANGGDGAVQLWQGADLAPVGKIALGGDADNVRVDPTTHRVLVGYGSGAIAVIDSTSRKKIADIRLKAHPEGFQIDRLGQRIIVNVPDAHEIAIIDSIKSQQTGSWATEGFGANFPLAIDEVRRQVLIGFRHPPTLGVFSLESAHKVATIETCADADDIFVDPIHSRVYITCGDGLIEVLAVQGNGYVKVARVATASGARTALFVRELDRLLLGVRAIAPEPAAVWVYRPIP